jgi:hypothetical protein
MLVPQFVYNLDILWMGKRDIREGSTETYSKKDDSARGCTTTWKNEIFPGDYVVIGNYFTLVI